MNCGQQAVRPGKYGRDVNAPANLKNVNADFWRDKRVFITGHTGFKGGWLAIWLKTLGATVHGYALAPPTSPNLFTVCNIITLLDGHRIDDIRDAAALTNAMQTAAPDVVLHLAAQPLVRYSYAAPVETYAVNVMGTVNLLEAVRHVPSVKAVVVVTSDKCYENQETGVSYRETNSMGGHDPYSSSKGCAELVAAAYRASFLDAAGVHVASARAGNVIGGGDWAADRLIPDFLRAMDAGQVLTIRSPDAVRPWQHVLEPLSGYLALAERLFTHGKLAAEAWNFGPQDNDTQPVRWIVDALCRQVPGAQWRTDAGTHPHEANVLRLDSHKAKTELGWHPRWTLATALQHTLEWHQGWRGGEDMLAKSHAHIHAFQATA